MAAQLADGGLEDLGVLGDGLRRDTLERHVAGEVVLVVAIGAVGSKEPPALLLAGVLESDDGHGAATATPATAAPMSHVREPIAFPTRVAHASARLTAV